MRRRSHRHRCTETGSAESEGDPRKVPGQKDCTHIGKARSVQGIPFPDRCDGTSAGKTFVTTNTAACLADAKKKVALLDLDLRKRTISGYFGLKHSTVGLSNYLNDESLVLSDILHKDVLDGVDFIDTSLAQRHPFAEIAALFLQASPELADQPRGYHRGHNSRLFKGVTTSSPGAG